MDYLSRSELQRVNNRRRDALEAEIRRNISRADQEIRKGYAALEDIRQARRNRKVMRPNLQGEGATVRARDHGCRPDRGP
jgi:hypothetical protein